MMKCKDIQKPSTLISTFLGPDGRILNGSQIASANGRSAVYHAVSTFVNENPDNPCVDNPFDSNGNYADKAFLYDAYDNNYALSYGDMILSKYGEKLDEVVPDSRFDEVGGLRTKLEIVSEILYNETGDLTPERVTEMIDNSMCGTAVDHDKMSLIARCGYEDAAFLMEHTTSESRNALLEHMDGEIDKDLVKLVGPCKDYCQAITVLDCMKSGYLSEASVPAVIRATNKLVDARSENNALYYSSYDVEHILDDLVFLNQEGLITLQDSSAKNSAQRLVQDYIDTKAEGFIPFVEDSLNHDVEMEELEDMEDVEKEEFVGGDILNTENVLKKLSACRTMDPSHAYFRAGENQLDAHGGAIETGYEFFTGGVSLYENGHLLFSEDSACVDNYHFEPYTVGKFTSLSDTMDYLREKYANVEGWESVDEPVPHVSENYPTVWKNQSYAREREAMENGTNEQLLDRVVFKNLGMFTGKNGTYHRVDFAYACDNKTVGEDKPMANPYVMSSKRKDASGKMETVHSYYLSDDIYNRLMSYANTDGLDNSKWSGVIAANVEYPANRNGKSKVSVNLTRDALKKGNIMTPAEPFNEGKHNAFVKASMAEVHKSREKMAASKLPAVGDMQAGAEASYGE